MKPSRLVSTQGTIDDDAFLANVRTWPRTAGTPIRTSKKTVSLSYKTAIEKYLSATN